MDQCISVADCFSGSLWWPCVALPMTERKDTQKKEALVTGQPLGKKNLTSSSAFKIQMVPGNAHTHLAAGKENWRKEKKGITGSPKRSTRKQLHIDILFPNTAITSTAGYVLQRIRSGMHAPSAEKANTPAIFCACCSFSTLMD